MTRPLLSAMIGSAFALSMVAASTAHAQTVVLGSSNARLCYEAALAGDRGSRQALTRCETAIDHDTLSRRDWAATHVNYGILLFRASRFDDAMSAYDRAIDLQPRMGEAWLNRGLVWLARSDYGTAEADFTQALELGLSEPHKAYYNRGLSYDSREMYPEAYADYHRALEYRPNWSLPLQELERFEVVRNSR